MIAHLKGVISKHAIGEVTVDIGGVGYRVSVPTTVWDELPEGANAMLRISTYVREDRLDLFGFSDDVTKTLFERFIELNGVGPRMGLELCAVPRGMLLKAVHDRDASLLQSIKGIGRKTAEKLLIELSSLVEKDPHMFAGAEGTSQMDARYDRDTIEALMQLGYATQDILKTLDRLPKDLATTEERVTAALRSL